MAFSAGAPMPVAQLALYQGADREKLLVEGAKREGQFTLYTSHTWFRTLVKDFEKKVSLSLKSLSGATTLKT